MKGFFWFGMALGVAPRVAHVVAIPIGATLPSLHPQSLMFRVVDENANLIAEDNLKASSVSTKCIKSGWHSWGQPCQSAAPSSRWRYWSGLPSFITSHSKSLPSTQSTTQFNLPVTTPAIVVEPVATSSSRVHESPNVASSESNAINTTSRLRSLTNFDTTSTQTIITGAETNYPDITGIPYGTTDIKGIGTTSTVSTSGISNITAGHTTTKYTSSASSLDSTTTLTITGTITVTVWPPVSSQDGVSLLSSTLPMAIPSSSADNSRTTVDATFTSTRSESTFSTTTSTSQKTQVTLTLLSSSSQHPCNNGLSPSCTVTAGVQLSVDLSKTRTLTSTQTTSISPAFETSIDKTPDPKYVTTDTETTSTIQITRTVSQTLTLPTTTTSTSNVTLNGSSNSVSDISSTVCGTPPAYTTLGRKLI